MIGTPPHIDPYLLELQLNAFRAFVQESTGQEFTSFAAHPYTLKEEGYKYDVYLEARAALKPGEWAAPEIGTGVIAERMIAAIELKKNNLVTWVGKYGEERRPHRLLYEAKSDPAKLREVEGAVYLLYRGADDPRAFAELVRLFGGGYPLLGYLYFLKDRGRYVPIAPMHFDDAFKLLGAEFKTSHKCSWENYAQYLELIAEIKTLLGEALQGEVTLLDAHSFAWILVSQMKGKTADLRKYWDLSQTERLALAKARVGQGMFRDALISYWSKCAVTGCREEGLLRASHIRPWAGATVEERLGLYNGLLLAPHIDAAFDAGFISFDDEGRILVSNRLSEEDARALGIHAEMRLSRIEEGHKKYLAYHRAHCFA